jgi:hypothetical protein
VRAIQTVYRGIEYRSRLEARWAAMFDRLGWQFTYEPFDGDGYIPDFLIHGEDPFLVEVKPAATRGQYREPTAKIADGLRAHWRCDREDREAANRLWWMAPVLLVGVSPMVPISEMSENCEPLHSLANIRPPLKLAEGDATFIGWLGQRWNDDWLYGPASLTRTREGAEKFEIVDWINYRAAMPFATRLPDRNGKVVALAADYVESLWAEACNDVKWRGQPVTT